MEKEERIQQQISPENPVGPKQPAVNEPKKINLKKAVIVGAVCIILAVLITAGGMAAAFLIGTNYRSNDLESKKQTVVQEGEVIADIAQKVGPSVVSIVTEQQSTVQSLYYGNQTRTARAAGTGVIIDSNGRILTNKHVVPESTSTVQVITSEGTRYKDVEVIGRDPLNDLAILKVKDPKNFTAASLGDSDSVRTGQKVIAIGNALGQFQNTVTSGIISGIGKSVEAGDEDGQATEQLSNLFQTDAAINSGNSGGPLLNFNGEVIGINTAVAADAENIGFAIPVNEAKGIIDSVKTTGKLTRPFVGIQYIMLTPDLAEEQNLPVQKGALISAEADSVVAGSPAAKAGLKAGDIITNVNTVTLSDSISLASAIGRFKVGDTVELTIIRDGKEQKVTVTLEQAPAN